MPEVTEDFLVEDYTFYLSMADIALLDVCKGGACANLPKEDLVKILFKNGLDTNKNYQFVMDTHRTLTGKIAKTVRVLGFMRKDPEWKELFGTDIHETIKELATNKKYRGSEQMFKDSF